MINLTNEIDFLITDPVAEERAQRYWENKDIGGVLCMMPNTHALDFVSHNLIVLLKSGVYEEALLSAFTSTRTNWSEWSQNTLNILFNRADREKLLLCGDPLPDDGPFIVYRGVAGVGRKRRVRGISWTSSFDTAKWFANRFSPYADYKNPAVFQLSVNKEDVLAYINGRSEQEFLIDVNKSMKPKKIWCSEPEDMEEIKRIDNSESISGFDCGISNCSREVSPCPSF